MAHSEKNCMKRLMHDLAELNKSPVENVSATPLEDNMLEWHCNIKHGEAVFHLILFFSSEYPYKPPSAEFVPTGFTYAGGATKHGRKGTQICLSIFSDFADVHTEWASERATGWSPAYTVQTILINVVSFLAEIGSDNKNVDLSRRFECRDCGHTYTTPVPALNAASPPEAPARVTEDALETNQVTRHPNVEIIDCISKEKFQLKEPKSEYDLFGYGVIAKGMTGKIRLTTSCEFLSGKSFYEMKDSPNAARSVVLKEELSFFLPLYIHPIQGGRIKMEFEKTMNAISERNGRGGIGVEPVEDIILSVVPNLMLGTVVDFFKGVQHTSENSLYGYFALHRLFLWAMETYPNLQDKLESLLISFVEDKFKRTKDRCPDLGEWLMLLAGSNLLSWQDVASAYLEECYKRNVMWYIKDDSLLRNLEISKEYRITGTFKHTAVSRNILAFQVVFLDVAMPENMSRADIIQRYDDNWGFPTRTMVNQMKEVCKKIKNDVTSYADWFEMLKLPVPTDEELFQSFIKAVKEANSTRGYYYTTR
ncbi:unnamed protein product [Lymnaea stagnalis]|uniref:UBC core domain-containing protein n=1 Tax=Lymnaea stagnalis TaxID=6523 RepID=A0AAV2H471_LYMST